MTTRTLEDGNDRPAMSGAFSGLLLTAREPVDSLMRNLSKRGRELGALYTRLGGVLNMDPFSHDD